jgi:glycosyltransferase involved in cell wall biosynthesis
MKISIICPGRNNRKYAEWGYDSIQKNKGNHEVEICFFDDASTDGTWEWCEEMMQKDPNFKAIRNTTSERVGHTIGYDRLVNEVATNDICMIYHADMYLCPGALDAIEKHMYSVDTFSREELEQDKLEEYERETGEKIDKLNVKVRNPKTIVSLTRIEPPLHPDGPEKVLMDCGVEPEEFKEEELLSFVDDVPQYFKLNKTTEGIFAPWAFWKKDFQEIGGHDPLYRPQSKEDSDIFNRFQLNGVKFVQTWEGFVYHMTCRGSRRNTNDKAKNIYEDSPEWLEQNMKSTRNFIRKWGHFVKHDSYMKPIIPNKYNIAFRVQNCNLQLLELLEPWCDRIYVDEVFTVGRYSDYCEMENGKTDYDMYKRVHSMTGENDKYDYDDIVVEIEGSLFREQDFRYLQQLPEILDQGFEVGMFELGNLKITVTDVKTYTNDLIKIETPYNTEAIV